jgi:hypothetical protein
VTVQPIPGVQGGQYGDQNRQFNYFGPVYQHPLPYAVPVVPMVLGSPPGLVTAFQERVEAEERLIHLLVNGSTAALAGDGGVGKTQLAARLFHRAGVTAKTDLRVWVTASSRHDVLAGFAYAAARLGLSATRTKRNALRTGSWNGYRRRHGHGLSCSTMS